MSENLTDLPGVGKKTAENLRRAGFDTYEKISSASIRRLMRVNGIGKKGAQKIIEAAGGTTIATQKQTEEERLRGQYGPIFDEIDEMPVEDIENELRGIGATNFGKKETTKPGETVFVPTDQQTAESPFRVSVKGPARRSINKIHQSRSERAQDVDEQQNAPITTDEEKWIENKNRYDYPGVDTIPESRKRKRAEKAAEVAEDIGAVDRVEQKGEAKTLGGKFSPEGSDTYGRGEAVARVQETTSQPDRTLAHEIGHAFDYSVGDNPNKPGLGEEIFDESPETTVVGREFDEDTDPLIEQAYNLSERARKGGGGRYRRQEVELTADAVSQTILNPRAARREAPDLVDRIEEKAEEFGFDKAIPDPLGNDPEPEGFLK